MPCNNCNYFADYFVASLLKFIVTEIVTAIRNIINSINIINHVLKWQMFHTDATYNTVYVQV